MDFCALGPLQVFDDDVPIRLGTAKSRCLLAALLCRSGKPVSVDALVEELWQTAPPPTARKTLQVYACRLRKALALRRLHEAVLRNDLERPAVSPRWPDTATSVQPVCSHRRAR